MKSAALILVIAAVAAASCGDEAEAVPAEAAPAEAREAEVAPASTTELAEPAEPRASEETFEGEAVTVTVHGDGRVHVRGSDRWGRPFDSVYQDGGYLARAMPALERTFGTEDAALLRRVAGSLPGADGDPTADEP